jgi:diguanylate cyclase (GGDEF)-like protein/PAS domain S-box-containing protein
MRADSRGRMLVWNKTAELVTGYSASDVLNHTDIEVFPPKLADLFGRLDTKMRTDPMVVDLPEVEFQRADGGSHYLRVISVPLFDDNDELEHVLGIAEDITGQRKQALALRMKQAELIAANEASPLGLFRTNETGQWTYVNRTYEEISGLDRTQSLGDGWVMAIHPDERLSTFQAWTRSLLNREPYEGTYRLQHNDGKIVWVSTRTAPIIVDGELHGYVGSIDDITTRREAEETLSKSEQRLRTITDTLPALVAFVDASERYRFNNLAYERTYGVSRESIRHQTIKSFLGEEEYRVIQPYIQRVLRGESVKFEQSKRIGGANVWTESAFIPQFGEDENRSVVGFHVMTQDITAKKLEERRLVQLAQIDSLTGLINRAGFEQKLIAAMANCREKNNLMALMYLDIDHFKKINDTRGHVVGDVLLKVFASRLQRTVRSVDTVCRLGGDEFSIILEDIGQQEIAENIAAKIVKSLQSLFSLEGELVPVTSSIGVAFYQGEPLEPKALIKRADEMLYQAKATGRNTYCVARLEPK